MRERELGCQSGGWVGDAKDLTSAGGARLRGGRGRADGELWVEGWEDLVSGGDEESGGAGWRRKRGGGRGGVC